MVDKKNFNLINESLSEVIESTTSLSNSIASSVRAREILGLNNPIYESLSGVIESTTGLSNSIASSVRAREILGLNNPIYESLSGVIESTTGLSNSIASSVRVREILGLNNPIYESLSKKMKTLAEISNLNSIYKSNLNVGVSNIFQINNSFNDMRKTLNIYGECYFREEDIEEFNNTINLEEKEVAKGEINEVKIFMIYMILHLLIAILMTQMESGSIGMDIESAKKIVYCAVKNIIIDQLSLSNVTEIIKKE